MSAATYQPQQASAKTHILKRFKNSVPGFHDEAILESETEAAKAYVLIKNDITGEVRCPCTWWSIHGRRLGQDCKHLIAYRADVAKPTDPYVQAAGSMMDDIFTAIGWAGSGGFARNKAVAVLAEHLRAFTANIPRAGQMTGVNGPAPAADPFGGGLRRIRFVD
jgi:hypothetical protein